MDKLILSNVTKSYNKAFVINKVNLEIDKGEFLSILGPSGSGKTTLLRLIAGFEKVNTGTIKLNKKILSSTTKHILPHKRNIGIMFQSYALWPHMTTAENIAFPLRVKKLSHQETQYQLTKFLKKVKLEKFANYYPSQLSGGQCQRIALARCLIMKPEIILLDEPLASLDNNLKSTLQKEFKELKSFYNATMMYVTHDKYEALSLSDRIVVMDEGKILQIGTPFQIYNQPSNIKVAEIIMSGTVVKGEYISPEVEGICKVNIFDKLVSMHCYIQKNADKNHNKGEKSFYLRPQDIRLSKEKNKGIPAVIKSNTYKGTHFITNIALENYQDIKIDMYLIEPLPVESRINIEILDGWVIPNI